MTDKLASLRIELSPPEVVDRFREITSVVCDIDDGISMHAKNYLIRHGISIGVHPEDVSSIINAYRTTEPDVEPRSYNVRSAETDSAYNNSRSKSAVPVKELSVTFSHKEGLYNSPITLELLFPIPGAEIFFTVDGSLPDLSSHKYPNKRLRIDRSVVITAHAFWDGGFVGNPASAVYKIIPINQNIIGGKTPGSVTLHDRIRHLLISRDRLSSYDKQRLEGWLSMPLYNTTDYQGMMVAKLVEDIENAIREHGAKE